MPEIVFAPADDNPVFSQAASEYEAMWKEDGERIIAAFQKITSLGFHEKQIKVIVYEGVSRAGLNESMPMRMRASYSTAEMKKATFIHELGHRLLFPLFGPQATVSGLDGHQVLFLFLYDVLEDLYGKEFADRAVAVESSRKGVYDYEGVWKWALALGAEKRKELFQTLLSFSK